MPLENRLAEIKGSLPRSKQKPNVESLTYVSMLSALMKEHTALGHENFVPESRQHMLRESVPVLAASSFRSRRENGSKRGKRPDMRWRNMKFQEWLNANPGAARDDQSDQVRVIAQVWADMDRAGKQRELSLLPEDDHHDADESDMPEPVVLDPSDWRSGDSKWPVGVEAMKRLVGGDGEGMCEKAAGLRWRARQRLVSTDRGAIQPQRAFSIRYSCSQRHHGLCFTRDADVYHEVLALAALMEKFFDASCVGKPFKLSGADNAAFSSESPNADTSSLLFFKVC
jgi:hypothetical protein